MSRVAMCVWCMMRYNQNFVIIVVLVQLFPDEVLVISVFGNPRVRSLLKVMDEGKIRRHVLPHQFEFAQITMLAVCPESCTNDCYIINIYDSRIQVTKILMLVLEFLPKFIHFING